jgi:SnoaL-like domain
MTYDNDAYLAIMRLHRSYADITTRRAWDEVASITAPDVRWHYTLLSGRTLECNGPAEYVKFHLEVNPRFRFFQQIPLNFVVDIGPDGTARGRSYVLEVAEDSETGDWINFYVVFRDQFAIVDGTWRFVERTARTVRRAASKQELLPVDYQPLSSEDTGAPTFAF